MVTIFTYLMWVCAVFNIYLCILTYKRFRDIDRYSMLYNKKNELLSEVEDLAVRAASIGVTVFLERGNEHYNGLFITSLQEFNHKLKRVKREFIK